MTNPKNSSALTPTGGQRALAELRKQMVGEGSRGVSFATEDQFLPLFQVGQTNSPIFDKDDPNYNPNGEPGDFILRVGGVSTLRSGEKGVFVIPSGFIKSWIGWKAHRQGFSFRSLLKPKDLIVTTEVDENGRERSVMKLGNDVVQESRDIFMLVADEQGDNWSPFMMPCVSTFHTFARQWNSYWGQIRDPETGGHMPSYSHQYKLTTFRRQNALGRWYVPKYQDLGEVTDMAAFNLALELNRAITMQTSSSDADTRPAA